MNNPCRYLRLFDLQKYREIEPVIKGIIQRNVYAQNVLSLLEAAIEVAESNEFIKYNDPDQDHMYYKELQDAVDVIQKSGIKAWFDQLDQGKHSGYDIIYAVIPSSRMVAQWAE